ncbi:amylo-alpha-1,6-glucosidase [Candidatus Nanohalobium constans]|uniref:Glycogen debranching enzyme (Alpha-1,6-glucosidase) n=1 Tax=Candidatus Nanohalobium constans TaxID=2565781 RepID=A0A5Q0UEW1_9ARCH|nr:amylo-alpha-1,6-glucosidase [Candidatus Nanohalobium constans]QGA80024.1 glycogen debranching enzyme (alpha-1,6-glucosidase) [Candidatus Nanohalobium constans]
MKYQVKENLNEKTGVISNLHGFLYTHLDNGFKEKWSGYWKPPYKYLDYIAVKVNGDWLDAENLVETEYGEKIIYHYETETLSIKQEISTPEKLNGFKTEFKVKNKSEGDTAVQTSVEPGVDIRKKSNDVEDRDYIVEENEGLKIGSGEKFLEINGDKFEFEEGRYYKEHFPGERQVCLIPGEITYRCELRPGETKESKLVFKTDGDNTGKIESHENTLRHPELGRTFDYSIESLENLIYNSNGRGIIAGHPWFQSYWARDSFWSVLGLIDAGYFEEVEKILLNFAERDSFPSKINLDENTEEDHARSDSIPLFAIAVDKLRKFYEPKDMLLDCVEGLLREERPNGKFVEHEPEGTWMDTLGRSNAVDIQSLWIEALNRFDRGTKRLQSGLEEFKREEYMADNLGEDCESINPAVSLMFGHVEDEKAEKYLEKINGEFSSRFGARTRSVTDPGYDASGYHTGSSWGLTTCWAAAANLEYGNRQQGVNFLEKMTQFVDRNQLGALPEVVDSESGEALGCGEQAWSAGLFVHVVDSYLFGISVKNGKVVIDPVDSFSGERRGKRVLGEELDVKVNNGEAKIMNETSLKVRTK